jgi:hypothetical protein
MRTVSQRLVSRNHDPMNRVRLFLSAGTTWLYLLFGLNEPQIATGQDVPGIPATPEAQECAALTALELSGLQEAPTKIVSATLVSVPAAGLDVMTGIMSSKLIKSQVTQYCDVTGYVAPQGIVRLSCEKVRAGNFRKTSLAVKKFIDSRNPD